MNLVQAFFEIAGESEKVFRTAVKKNLAAGKDIPRRHAHYKCLLLVLKQNGKVRYGRRVARTVEQLDTIILKREA